MPRPKKPRFVSGYPAIAAFVPQGVPVTGELFLSVEELEAIRLSDFERLDQESAANLMQVSRQTYGRILSNARGIVGEALVTGKALKVEGGTYEMRGRGRGRGRRRKWGKQMSVTEEITHEKEVETMPLGDGTGPQGQGPRTGKGQGRCNPNNGQPSFNGRGRKGSGQGTGRGQGQGQGQGTGRGAGRGRGRRQQ